MQSGRLSTRAHSHIPRSLEQTTRKKGGAPPYLEGDKETVSRRMEPRSHKESLQTHVSSKTQGTVKR